MQYALDANGSWANAKLTEYKKHSQFFCACVERHPVKLVKPSGELGKRPFSDYFAHITRSEQDAADGRAVRSCGCTESPEHFNAKHKLREMVGRYTFTTFRCSYCRNTGIIDSAACEVVVEKTSRDRKWRYDCLLRTGGKDVAALEVLHSHKVTREKASSVRDGGLEIAEFRAEDILHLLTDSPSKTVHLENLLMRHVTCCEKCIKQRTKMEMWFTWDSEVHELQRQNAQMYKHHQFAARERELQKKLLACRQRHLVQNGLAWHLSCWRDELQELVAQEAHIASDYHNAVRYKKLLAWQTVLEKCRRLYMPTHRSRRLRLWAQRATRWMARFARTLRV